MSRGSRLIALAATAALSLATAVLPSTNAFATTTTPVAHQWRGAQLHLMWGENTDADITRQLDMLAAAGADSARLDVAWSSLQDTSASSFASWYVSKLDTVVAGAIARNIHLILTLQETPCWASSAPDSIKLNCSGAYWDRGVTHYAPTNPSDYATAARYIAARYGTRIAALEVWNEPNWDDGTIAANLIAPDKAAAYVAMLRPAYSAVKTVAPGLPVLAAAMAFSDVPWLQSLYAAGARGYYDGISVHPYNEWRPIGAPHDIAWAKYDFVQGLNALHTAMLDAGDSSPLWITEVGWSSCLSGGGTDRWCVTEQQQADYLPDAFRVAAGWSWIASVMIYNLRAKGTSLSDREACFGLVHHDYSTKPALAAFTAVLTELASSPAPTASSSPSPTPTATTTTTAPSPTPTATTTTTAPSPSPTATTTTTAPSPSPTATTTTTAPSPSPTPTATSTSTAPKLRHSKWRSALVPMNRTRMTMHSNQTISRLTLRSHRLAVTSAAGVGRPLARTTQLADALRVMMPRTTAAAVATGRTVEQAAPLALGVHRFFL
jgi:hypothetical protein